MREILFLEPVFKEMIWGGRRLKDVYGYDIPGDDTGECWAISAHPSGDCTVREGRFQGMSLSGLWNSRRELFGGLSGEVFPLLIKIIDARDDLSIQVHPDDTYAGLHENGALGKTECWYIQDAPLGGEIVIGHHAKDHEQVEEMIRGKKWDSFIRKVPVKKGDFFQINPGCVHAIKGGTLILETQQNSDITYRVYDYDRLSGGSPRQLHVEQSIDVIKAPFVPAANDFCTDEGDGWNITRLVSCPYYSVYKLHLEQSYEFEQVHPFINVSVIDGEGTVDAHPVRKGCHFILPADYGICRFEGSMTLICSIPGLETAEDTAWL